MLAMSIDIRCDVSWHSGKLYKEITLTQKALYAIWRLSGAEMYQGENGGKIWSGG
jgi:hypothetical protein